MRLSEDEKVLYGLFDDGLTLKALELAFIGFLIQTPQFRVWCIYKCVIDKQTKHELESYPYDAYYSLQKPI